MVKYKNMAKDSKSKIELENSTAEAVKAISSAAGEAVKAIAQAAGEARLVLINNAAEAAKVLNIKNTEGGSDHDLLQRLDTKVDALKSDIKEIKDGTTDKINRLSEEKLDIKDSYPVLYKVAIEKKLDDLDTLTKDHEKIITRICTWGAAALLAMGIIEFLINKFM